MKPVVLIENLRLFSTEQIEMATIAKQNGLEVRYFDTFKTSLKIVNPKKFLNVNEEYIVFCSVYTLKALRIDDIYEQYTLEELVLLKHLEKFIYYDVKKFNNIQHKHMFNTFNEVTCSLFSKFKESVFVKSVTGLKEFNSGVINSGETFKSYLNATHSGKEILKQYYKSKLNSITYLESSVKSTYEANEYRFFVKKKKIIAQSQYMNHGVFECSEVIKEAVHQFAAKMIKLYQPMPYFVIDIIEIDGKLSVLEYNCLNSSGMYDINKQVLLKSLVG